MKFIAEACMGEILRGAEETLIKNVCTDSRQAGLGDLFFAIKGERFDGHEFLKEVAAKGVTAVVIERNKIPAVLPDCAVLIVDDVRAAFGKFAAIYRSDFDLPAVAVAGSNGKTTTERTAGRGARSEIKNFVERGELQQRHRRAGDIVAVG